MTKKKNLLDKGVEPMAKTKRTRRTKHAFKLSDIQKADVKNTGFNTKISSHEIFN